MRKITKESVAAFNNGVNFKKANMEVEVVKNNVFMYLHDNLIAQKVNGVLSITNAGWQSNTTKERLNGLDGVSINQKSFVWYLNGEKWDGNLIEIKK
jgi:hypothetical protein